MAQHQQQMGFGLPLAQHPPAMGMTQPPPQLEVRSDSDSKMDVGASAVHQATIRVNSLSLSETPALRKRNREDDDHSFRVDKMAEAPATVPRSQAVLTPEEYLKQQQQHNQAAAAMSALGRDDSMTLMFPVFLPHSNSTGSNGSNSFINFLASQESFANQDGSVAQQQQQQQQIGGDGSQQNAFAGFKPAQFVTLPGNQPGMQAFSFVPGAGPFQLGAAQNQGQAAFLQQNQGLSAQLQPQGSTMSLSSQPSLNMGGPAGASLSLGASQLGLGASTSSLNLGNSAANLSMSGSNLLGLNLGGVMGVPIGITTGPGGAFQPGAPFLSFGSMAQPGGFESYMGDLRPRYEQAGGPGGVPPPPQGFFPFTPYPPTGADGMMASMGKRSSASNGSKSRKGGTKGSKSGQSAGPSAAQAAAANAAAAAQAAAAAVTAAANAAAADKYVSWTSDQERALIEAVEDLGTADWEAIAARVPGAHRTSAQCIRHWENKLSPHIKRGQWSPEEDEALKDLVDRASVQGLGLLDIPWEDIKPHIPGRTLKQVRERWRSNLDPNIVRGEWSPYEDEMIIKMRDEQGMGWAAIARALKGRTEHSVKTRHRSMQRAKKRVWTEKEDRTILEMVQAGCDFGTIANELKNRTAASVELRWGDLRAHA